jgi:hypothetical protein
MPFEPYDFFVPVVKITKPTGVSIFNDKYLGNFRKNGGVNGTRTRGLHRDRVAL